MGGKRYFLRAAFGGTFCKVNNAYIISKIAEA
jgi:hypothetical protein